MLNGLAKTAMELIDSHCHLTYPGLIEQVDPVLARAAEAGVGQMITVGTSLEDARAAVGLASRNPGRVFVAAGIHPHHAGSTSFEEIEELVQIWRRPEVVACGEMGLDYHYDFAERGVQRAIFTRQLELALDLGKAVVIHSRESIADTSAVLLDAGYRGRKVVFHCFTGTAEEASLLAGNGWRISFTGVVTFRKSDWLQEIARGYPADQIMVETDAPYLSPEPVRGRRPNEPAFVAHTARFLAELRGEDGDEFARRATRNTRDFFGTGDPAALAIE